MEVIVLAGLIGAGYYINDNKRKTNIENFEGSNINSTTIPNHNDLYDLNNYETSQQMQEISAQELIGDMLSGQTNIVDSTQTMNNTHRNIYLNLGEDDSDQVFSNNSDEFIDKENFLRNDQGYSAVPYYKGNSAPTINLESNHGFQASMGGAAATTEWKPKRETENIGDWYMPENIHGNQWGSDVNSDFNRYIPGTMRTGELPFDQEQIQHIDEKSFDNRLIDEAIANTRNIDNLRSLNNQQKTYTGRIIPGEKINVRGIEGQVEKNKVEKYHELGEDRNLVTTGAVIGSSKRPNQVMPDTNRQYLNKMKLGPASPLDGIEEVTNRPFISKSMKTPLDPDNNRNIGGNIRITDPDNLGYKAYPNERQVTEERTYQGNIKGEYEGRTVNIQDSLKPTIKETTLDPANNGFITGEMDKFADYTARLSGQVQWHQSSRGVPELFEGGYSFSEIIGDSGLVPSKKIRMGLFLQNPNVDYPSHAHEAEEFYLILSGHGSWEIGNSWFDAIPGRIFHHQPGESHRMITESEPLLAIWIWTGLIEGRYWFVGHEEIDCSINPEIRSQSD